jgi:putative transcriptional regulator
MVSSIEQLAPGFLIAAPTLQDPNFVRTVVLMCLHNEEGAMGLVINRTAPFSMGEIMEQLGVEYTGKLTKQALVGGPVALDNGLLLYRVAPGSSRREDEISVSDELRLCPSRDLLLEIGQGREPKDYHMFLGHAGWGPGQLELEIAQAAWVPATLSMDLIFTVPFEDRWDEALRAEGLNAAQLGTFRPQA